jgi:hypothetical protein
MSGGSMNYLYSHIQDAEFELTTPQRIAFKQHLNLVAEACKAIEWVDSGDNSEGSENQFIIKCINNKDNEEELITLLSTLYKDAQMGIDEEWVPVGDKEGWEAQQVLIDTYCRNNNIEIRKE